MFTREPGSYVNAKATNNLKKNEKNQSHFFFCHVTSGIDLKIFAKAFFRFIAVFRNNIATFRRTRIILCSRNIFAFFFGGGGAIAFSF